MPLRPRFELLGVSDVVGCAPLLEPAGSNPGGVVAVRDTAARPNRLVTSPHRRDDTSLPTRPAGFLCSGHMRRPRKPGLERHRASHLLLARSTTRRLLSLRMR